MQYHSYIFLSPKTEILKGDHKQFLDILESDKDVISNSYATLGLKTDTNILFWFQSESLEKIQDFINKLMHTNLGRNLKISHTLLGMTRPTQYSPKSKGHLNTDRKGGKYLVIYPFTKTKDWYQLSFEKRKNLMWGHVQFGKKHPKIEQTLLYSYGIDDSEFIVSYETDDLLDFQTLVMELRSDKVRAYTQKDTPIFTCIYKPFKEVLEYL
jgi:chlorite dismutase